MAPVGFSNRPNIGTFPDFLSVTNILCSDYFLKHCEMENSSISGYRGGMEMEEVWSDLHALKKLYGLLQRTNGVMIPHGECQDIILDEKSRQLLKKLLDGATQEAIQCQSKILSKSSTGLPDPSEKTQEEPKCNPSSLEVPEEKVQQAEKREAEPNPCHPVCKRAELKHQKSDKTMKTGLDLKPRKRSEHPLPDLHRRILQDRHRARSEVSSSGDPNQPRPSGSLLVRNPSRLGRSSKRTRVDAPGRTRPFPRPVDESTRHRRAGDTNSVSSHVIKPPVPSTRPFKVNQTAEIGHHLRKKEVEPTESKPSKLSGTRRPSPRQLRTEMRVKPIRYSSMTSSDSTATGSLSSSTGPESRTSDETLSRRRVPCRSPHLIARRSVPILVHGEKSPPCRMLSQHKKVGPRRRSTSKDLPREQEKRRGRLKRFLKDKLALIFHHHHHHHHYHHHRPGHVDGDGEVVQGNNHASPWRYVRRVVHRNGKERAAERAPGQQRLGLLHVLLDALLRHVWGTPQRRAAQAKWMRLGNAGKKKPRWWQVFRRRGGLKLANQNKPRLKLGFSRAHSGANKRKT